MKFFLGDQETSFFSLISTERAEMAIISESCGRLCDVPSKVYSPESDSDDESSRFTSFEMTYFERGSLQYNTFSGHWTTNDFHTSKNQDEFEVPYIAIEDAIVSYKSPFSGYIGLAPPYSLKAQ